MYEVNKYPTQRRLGFKCLFIYLERACVHVQSRGGAERGGERIPGRFYTVSMEPGVGLYLKLRS